MQIAELIALAKVRSGKSQKEMAQEMGYTHPNFVSKIATGVKAADASEIIYLAQAANMEPIEVLADFESERHPELAAVWKNVKANMRNVYLPTLRRLTTAASKVLRPRVTYA